MINYKDMFSLSGCEAYVIGGSGLIGSQIVSALEAFGASTTVFDLDVKNKKNINKTKYIKFNCRMKKM